MTRILSVIKLLKRVEFAVLLLDSSVTLVTTCQIEFKLAVRQDQVDNNFPQA